MSTPTLVEPSATVVEESKLPAGVAATVPDATPEVSSEDALKSAMSKLAPAKPEPSSAQRLSAPEVEKPAGDVKTDLPPIVETSESALESFRTDLKQARRVKQKSFDDKDVVTDPVVEEKAPVVEAKPEGVKPADAPATPETDDQPVTEEEIQKTINDPAISKRHQKRMVHLANEAKALREKLATMEAKPQTNANDEKIKVLEEEKKQAESELIKYRRRYSLENEPELKKFDEVATKANDAILQKLKEYSLSDGTITMIKNAGGFDEFSRSNQTFKINVVDSDGETVEQQITAAKLSKKWLEDMNIADSEYIRAKLSEKFNSVDAKKRLSEELASDSANWFKAQREQYEEKVKTQSKLAEESASAYKKWADEFETKQEWIKDMPVPVGATPEEKANVEAFNKYNTSARALVKSASNISSVPEFIVMVEAAAQSERFKRDAAIVAKENASLKQQIDRLRAGVSTTGKPGGGSIARAPAKKADDSVSAQLQTSSVDNLREAMENMRRDE